MARSPSRIASSARAKSSKPMWPSRGATTTSGGSPAIRLRVMRICMTSRLVAITFMTDGDDGRGSTGSGNSRPRLLRTQLLTGWVGVARAFFTTTPRPSIPELRSTAMTTSAPMARASDTGTGFTSAPSTRMPSSVSTGVNNPGIASDARTAASVDPVRSQTSAPVSSDVATAANGIARSSMGRSWKPRPMNAMNRWPLSRPPVRHTSMNDRTSRRRMPQVPVQNRSKSPVAYAAPTSAPTEVPQTMSGRTPARSSARTTPTCAQPRAAPLPSTSASRGARRVRANRDS